MCFIIDIRNLYSIASILAKFFLINVCSWKHKE